MIGISLAVGCGPATPEANGPDGATGPDAHAHGHDPSHHGHMHGDHAGHHGDHGNHGDGPLVHRFENAADWAKEFDKPERDAWQKPAEVVTLLQIAPGMKVADLGAGTGYFEPHLSRAVGPTGSVLALDVEDSMVAYITERAKKESLANVTAQKVPFDDPKVAAGSLDRILVVDTWHHIPGRDVYTKKLADGLKPGGFLAVVDFTLEAKQGPPPEHRLSADAVKKELEAAGLTGEIATETLPDQYVVFGKKPAK